MKRLTASLLLLAGLAVSALSVSAETPKDNGDGTLTIEDGMILKELPIKYGAEETVAVGFDETVTILVPEGGWDSLVPDLPEVLEAPVQKGEVVGSLKAVLSDGREEYIAIVAMASVGSTFPAWFSRYSLWICSGIMILIVILILYLRRQRKLPAQNRMRKK